MEDPAGRRPASFRTQANALFRKNLVFQKRNMKTNCRLISFPIILCLLLFLIQQLIDSELNDPKNKCGCACTETNSDGSCKKRVCAIEYSTLDQVGTCAIPSPPEWTPMLQVPRSEYRAVSRGSQTFSDLPEESCRATKTCPAIVLFTGNNRTLGNSVLENFFTIFSISSISDASSVPDNATLGTSSDTETENFIEPAFLSERPVYTVQSRCSSDSNDSIPFLIENVTINRADVECVRSSNIWRGSSSEINDELYKGYRETNIERQINEIMTAYDFLNSNQNNFNVNIWYNSTYNDEALNSPSKLVRVTRLVNLVSNAYLQLMRGKGMAIQFEFTKEMPKVGKKTTFDFSSLLGPLFFSWIIELLFPVLLTYLVYEKQQKLRIMMKMHGLGDGPYWIISYGYFLLISMVYVLFLIIFGSIIDLKFFTENDYSLQFAFYFAFINLQIALSFFFASVFSNVKSAQASAYIYIFGSGLLAGFLLDSFIKDLTFSSSWITVMEILPAFALYRGLFEFADYATLAQSTGTSGMTWKNLNDDQNGLGEVLLIILIEWVVLLPLAYYLDQLSSLGSKIRNDPLFFLKCFHKKQKTSLVSSSKRQMLSNQGSKITIDIEKPDVIQERELVERLVIEPSTDYAIVCDNLKKVYPGRDGNQSKLAVQGLSLALQRGECFGMLGPNGAGKTSFISMMIGLTPPTSGNAYVEQLSIQADMDKIYTSMGVCPQHDMLWEMLTGREHLMFYGRLKNLKGSALIDAVQESLRSVNLLGVGDKQSRKYSGGMKRRLSVAISLIGDPKVVYMDEPSTGLDPASRNNLWNVVKRAKQNRAIILTTHSMEEAEVLCDRLGIFVGGNFQCIGNPNQLKARYGGDYVFTMTTSSSDEKHVEDLVRRLSSNAKRTYHISGTQKFEIPKKDVKIAGVFQAVEDAKKSFGIQAWGMTDTTLEDVFIKVANE